MTKQNPSIGCCGLDCGLCPRYYTEGSSRCPGCCGPEFFSKHPSCSIVTCCLKKNNFETCSNCAGFPCNKYSKETIEFDSFITHRNLLKNLNLIKASGLQEFIDKQKERIRLLQIMLENYDDGKSKSFYCLSCTLISISGLTQAIKFSEKKIKINIIQTDNIKQKAEILRNYLNIAAKEEKVELKLRKKL